MKRAAEMKLMLTPLEKEGVPSWASDRTLTAERVLLNGVWYADLRGRTIASGSDGLPWERGVVVIERVSGKSRRRIRRLFHGANSAGVGKDSIGLDATALYSLRAEPGDTVLLRLSIAGNPFSAAVDRVLFAWDHPDHAVRIAFKLGALGVAISLTGIVDSLLNAVIMLRGG